MGISSSSLKSWLIFVVVLAQVVPARAECPCEKSSYQKLKDFVGTYSNKLSEALKPETCQSKEVIKEFSLQACSEKLQQMKNYVGYCSTVRARYAHSLSTQLLRREQLLWYFDRELQLMSRLGPTTPGFDKRWSDFENKWRKRFADEKEITFLDTSSVLKPDHRGAIEARLGKIKEMKDGIVAFHNEVAKKTGLTKGTAFDLLKTGFILQSYDSYWGQKYAQNEAKAVNDEREQEYKTQKAERERMLPKDPYDPGKPVEANGEVVPASVLGAPPTPPPPPQKPVKMEPHEAVDMERDFVSNMYPEFVVDPSLLTDVKKTLSKKINVDRMNDFFFMKKADGNYPDVKEKVTTLNKLFSMTLTNDNSMNGDFEKLELHFLRAMDKLQGKFDESIEKAKLKPEEVYDTDAFEMGAISSLNPDDPAGRKMINDMGSYYCTTKDQQIRAKKAKEIAMFVGGGVALAAGTVTLGATAFGTAALLAGSSAATIAAADAVAGGAGLAVLGSIGATTAGDVYNGVSAYNDAVEKFYRGIGKQSDVAAAREEKNRAEMWAAVNVLSLVPGLTLAKAAQMQQAAAASGNINSAIRATQVVNTMKWVDRGIEAGFAGFNVKEGNWFGLAFQVNGTARTLSHQHMMKSH